MKLSREFVLGLIAGEGSFSYDRRKNGNGTIQYIPSFTLRMHVRDIDLVRAVRNYLGLDIKVYEYFHNNRHYAVFVVRNIGDIKNIIVPFFYKRLHGYKAKQFEEWIERMGREDTTEGHKLVYFLYKRGWYDKPENVLKYPWRNE